MLSKNGNVYLTRKGVITELGRPYPRYVLGASQSHTRPTQYEPAATQPDTVTSRVVVQNTREREEYNESSGS